MKYTVADLIEMRRHIADIITQGKGASCANPATVEDQLRTYRQNGTSAEELRIAAERWRDIHRQEMDHLVEWQRSAVNQLPTWF